MTKCESCGNDYDRLLAIQVAGETHYFDCFECAIHVLAPGCSHCGTKILGHGLQTETKLFCCAHCARAEGENELCDSVA